MELVDEENDLPFTRLNFFENCFQALFELAAKLGAGNQGAHVERDDFLLFQALGNVAAHDALSEPFRDRRFADTRLADEHRVVLCAAREHLNDAANLLVAADHRIKLALSGHDGQVAAIFLQGLVGGLGILSGHALAAANVFDGLV